MTTSRKRPILEKTALLLRWDKTLKAKAYTKIWRIEYLITWPLLRRYRKQISIQSGNEKLYLRRKIAQAKAQRWKDFSSFSIKSLFLLVIIFIIRDFNIFNPFFTLILDQIQNSHSLLIRTEKAVQTLIDDVASYREFLEQDINASNSYLYLRKFYYGLAGIFSLLVVLYWFLSGSSGSFSPPLAFFSEDLADPSFNIPSDTPDSTSVNPSNMGSSSSGLPLPISGHPLPTSGVLNVSTSLPTEGLTSLPTEGSQSLPTERSHLRG